MEINCICGLGCIKDSSEILENINNIYTPCDDCFKPVIKKFKPLKDQVNLNEIDGNFGKCRCGKRHLDLVMAHTLKIMIEEEIKSTKSTLRNCCTPLITPAYPTATAPYLKENSMVILAEDMNKQCANRLVKEVPEIKGVIQGNIREVVGLKDSESTPNVYELLAGCDVRCDVVLTNDGPICIFRNQAKIHIEFSKPVSPKIQGLKKYLDKYENPTVIDFTCGPGTLGIACLKAGAKKVVFNDIWYPSVKMTMVNLEVNGYETEFLNSNTGLVGRGENFEVYCCDVKNLKNIINEEFDLGILDTFPGVDNKGFIEAVKNLCKEIVVI